MATTSDKPVEMSEKQAEALSQFRERVKEIIEKDTEKYDNYYLSRWLRARGYDVDKAEKMFRSSLAWREKWKVDDLLDTWSPPPAMLKYFPGGLCGYDKQGSPVWIEPIGTIDMRGLSLSSTKEDFIKFCIYTIEKIHRLFKEQTAKYGRKVGQVILISDMQGFGMKQLMAPGMDNLLKVMAIIEANYPECLKQCYVINAPAIWGLVYNICKPFLSEDTKRKIVVVGSDWKEKLLEVIDADQLPVHWGGTQTGPNDDPYCSHKVVMGGEVASEHYLQNQHFVDPELWTETSIAAGSKLDISLRVDEAGSVINWVFKTHKHDIAYSIKYCESEESKTAMDLITSHRVSSHNIPEMGQIECDKPGIYTFRFSNEFSWMNGKKLGYYVAVAQPSEAERRADQYSGTLLYLLYYPQARYTH